MDAINAVASFLNRSIDIVHLYLKENAIAIGTLLAALYYFRTRYHNGRLSQGYVLSSSPDSSIVKGIEKKKNSHQKEMRRVRQHQQQIANERAKEAASKRKEKEAKERDRRNQAAKNKKSGITGNRLGDGSSDSSDTRTNGRNPMQPLTSNTQSFRRNPET